MASEDLDVEIHDISASDDENNTSFDDIVGERLSAATFSDLLRKACLDFTLFLKKDSSEEQLIDSLQVLQTFVLSSSVNLSTDEVKMVLDLVLCACAKVEGLGTLKQGILFLNQWIANKIVWKLINSNHLLRPYVIAMGKRIYDVGDYETQALLLECLIRIVDFQKQEDWTQNWFAEPEAVADFHKLNPQDFEIGCRHFMNCINNSARNQTVFSFIANSVMMGSLELKKPHGVELWIDFNYCSKSVSFYCMDPFAEEQCIVSETSVSMWETFVINENLVDSCFIEICGDEQLLIVNLHISYFEFLSFKCDDLHNNDGRQFSFGFPCEFDIGKHVHKIFGNRFKESGVSLSDCVERDGFHVEDYCHFSQVSSQGSCRKRKASCSVVCFQSFITDVDTPKSDGLVELDLENQNIASLSYEDQEVMQIAPEVGKATVTGLCTSDMELTPNVVPQSVIEVTEHDDAQAAEDSRFEKATFAVVSKAVENRASIELSAVETHESKLISETKHPTFSEVNLISDDDDNAIIKSSSDSDVAVPPTIVKVSSLPAEELEGKMDDVTVNKLKSHNSEILLESEILENCSMEKNVASKQHIEKSAHKISTQEIQDITDVQNLPHQSPNSEIHRGDKSLNDIETPNQTLLEKSHVKNRSTKRLQLFKSNSAPVFTASPEAPVTPATEPVRKLFRHKMESSITEAKSQQDTEKMKTSEKKSSRNLKIVQKKKPKSRLFVTQEEHEKKTPDVSFSFTVTEDPPNAEADTQISMQKAEQSNSELGSNKDMHKDKTAYGDSGFETAVTTEKKSFVTIEASTCDSPSSSREEIDQSNKDSPKATRFGRKAAQLSVKKTQELLKNTRKKKDVFISSEESEQSLNTFSPVLKKRSNKDDVLDIDTDVSTIPWKTKSEPDALFNTPVKSYNRRKSSSKKNQRSSSKKTVSKKRKAEAKQNEAEPEKPESVSSSTDNFQLVIEKTAKNPLVPVSSPEPRGISAKINRSDRIKHARRQLVSEPSRATRQGLRKRFTESASSTVLPPSTVSREESPALVRKKPKKSAEHISTVLLEELKSFDVDDVQTDPVHGEPVIDDMQKKYDSPNVYLDEEMKSVENRSVNEEQLDDMLLQLGMDPTGKTFHLKRFIEDIPANKDVEDLVFDDNEDAFETESVLAIHGSPTNLKICDSAKGQMSAMDMYSQEQHSTDDENMAITPQKKRPHKKVREFAAFFERILQKHRDACSSSTSSSEFDCSCCDVDVDGFPYVQEEKLISPTFFKEAQYLSRKFISTIQKFTSDFFSKLSASRRQLFFSISSSQYEELIMAKNIFEYQKSSSLYRAQLHKQLDNIRSAVDAYIALEKEFDYSMQHTWVKAFKKFKSEMQESNQKAIKKQEAELIAELKKRLNKLLKNFIKKGEL